MWIYFEEGRLEHNEALSMFANIDAGNGVSYCKDILKSMSFAEKHGYRVPPVRTNSLVALNNDYVWDDKDSVPELYLRRYNSKIGKYMWTRVDKLTDKEIRKEHNLMKMYLAGSFDEDWNKDE